VPDICMCTGTTEPPEWATKTEDLLVVVCEQRETCYRYKAIPCEYRQSYFMLAPLSVVTQEGSPVKQACGYYWPIENS
jgi:hypothetical protein